MHAPEDDHRPVAFCDFIFSMTRYYFETGIEAAPWQRFKSSMQQQFANLGFMDLASRSATGKVLKSRLRFTSVLWMRVSVMSPIWNRRKFRLVSGVAIFPVSCVEARRNGLHRNLTSPRSLATRQLFTPANNNAISGR